MSDTKVPKLWLITACSEKIVVFTTCWSPGTPPQISSHFSRSFDCMQEIERFVSVRVKPDMLTDLQTFSQRGWKQRMISLLLANWAFLKHPLIRSFTALDVSENHPFFVMFNLQQFEEPGFCGYLHLGFHVSRHERVRVRSGMMQRYFTSLSKPF